MATVIVLVLLALAVCGSIRLIRKNRASGGCAGNCADCHGCPSKK